MKEKLASMSGQVLALGLFFGYYLITFRRYQLAVDKH